MRKILIISIVLLFNSCQLIPDLDRDNPLDENSSSYKSGTPLLEYSRFEVVGDNNNNGVINVGETIYLKVYLKNIGTGIANLVHAKFSFESYSYIYFYGGTASYGDVAVSSEVGGVLSTTEDYSMKFSVNYDIPIGTIIKINISITDNNYNVVSGAIGTEWLDSFTITIQ